MAARAKIMFYMYLYNIYHMAIVFVQFIVSALGVFIRNIRRTKLKLRVIRIGFPCGI